MSAVDANLLFDASPVAMLVIDGDTRIVRMNAAAEDIVRMSAPSARGHPLGVVLGLPLTLGEEPISAYDCRVVPKRGEPISLDLHVTPLPDFGVRLVSLHARASADALDRRSEDDLSVVGVAAMLAHEIKNPLAGIRGAAQLLGETAGETRLTGLIRDEVDRIARLIDRMERFTDDRALERIAANIHAVIDDALASLELASQRRRLVQSYDPSLPEVLIDPASVGQIVLNLLRNALDASPVGSPVTIETRYRPGIALRGSGGRRRALPVEVAVIDHGDGPPIELREHMFRPFVSSKGTGRGIGLALVERLARDNGGMIQFTREEKPPRTVFRLLLEVAR